VAYVDVCGECFFSSSVRPTQTALGWDWVLFKMKNLATEEDAAAYLDRKPVPVVKRGDLYYAVDHHHTLAALQVSVCFLLLDSGTQGKWEGCPHFTASRA